MVNRVLKRKQSDLQEKNTLTSSATFSTIVIRSVDGIVSVDVVRCSDENFESCSRWINAVLYFLDDFQSYPVVVKTADTTVPLGIDVEHDMKVFSVIIVAIC